MKRSILITIASIFFSSNALAFDSVETSGEAVALSVYGTVSLAAAGVYSASAILSVPVHAVSAAGSLSHPTESLDWQAGDKSFPITEETFSKLAPPNVAIESDSGVAQ